MNVVIPGGSGHLGTIVATALHERGDRVTVVSRKPSLAPWPVIGWDRLGEVINGADVVINLAGRNVNCRYNAHNRSEIYSSRIDSTRAIGRAIRDALRPPRLWLQSSTATIYAHRFDAPNAEVGGIIGGSEEDARPAWAFSIDVATKWERAADEIPLPSTRLVKLRTAIVMSPFRGSAFPIFRNLARLGLAGRQGSGRQFVSWIHYRDFVRAVEWLIEHEEIAGVVNVAAPNPLPNAEFLREIRAACGVPLGIPAPAWLLEIAAFFHRTETELLLKSRRVVPQRLLEAGFAFEHPTWHDAAQDLCHNGGTKEW